MAGSGTDTSARGTCTLTFTLGPVCTSTGQPATRTPPPPAPAAPAPPPSPNLSVMFSECAGRQPRSSGPSTSVNSSVPALRVSGWSTTTLTCGALATTWITRLLPVALPVVLPVAAGTVAEAAALALLLAGGVAVWAGDMCAESASCWVSRASARESDAESSLPCRTSITMSPLSRGCHKGGGKRREEGRRKRTKLLK